MLSYVLFCYYQKISSIWRLSLLDTDQFHCILHWIWVAHTQMHYLPLGQIPKLLESLESTRRIAIADKNILIALHA